jgi:hypothetical protein
LPKDGWTKVIPILDFGVLRLNDHFPSAQATLARLHAQGDINDPFVISQMKDMKVELHKSRDIGESRYDVVE